MSSLRSETIIKDIINQICQTCSSKMISVSEALAAFMVKSIVMNPENKFNTVLTNKDVEQIITLSIERLTETESLSLDTIKMQVYFDLNYSEKNEFIDEHRKVLQGKIQPIMQEIVDCRARTKDELNQLYRKIVSATIIFSGLGGTTEIQVLREATAALQSVFSESELTNFTRMKKKEKLKHLQELSSIVAGIRLFNKDCGKGGKAIENVPAKYFTIVEAEITGIQQQINSVVDSCDIVTTFLEDLNRTNQSDNEGMVLLRDVIVNCRQYEIYASLILNDMANSAKEMTDLYQQFKNTIEILRNTIQDKSSVPTGQVYPQFYSIYQYWKSFQEELVVLELLKMTFNNLSQFTDFCRLTINEKILNLTKNITKLTNDDRLIAPKEYEMLRYPQFAAKYRVIKPDEINFDKLPVYLQGFCANNFIKYNGLLIPANTKLGLIEYKNLFFAFSDRANACEFIDKISENFSKLIKFAYKNTEFINLLDLQSSLDLGESSFESNMFITKRTCDYGMQTELHVYESNIDPNYQWNEWEMRRQAIKLANLRTKLTKSCQTNNSNNRRENCTQVYPPKEFGVQTKGDGYSNVPKPQVFLAGLRGCPNENSFKKIDLTREIND